MAGARRWRLVRCAGAAGALMLAAAGCAVQRGPLQVEKPAESALPVGITPQAAQDAVTVGRSTKAEVAAALGPATVVKFDSGYEVWVYQTRQPKDTVHEPTEFVILFAPSGIAKKTRIRPGDVLRRQS